MKILSVKILLTSFALLLAHLAHAGGNVTSVDVIDSVVVFIISEEKTAELPDCVLAENANKWAFSMETLSGKAAYSMLMTAMNSNLELEVSSSGTCDDFEGFETPDKIALLASTK